MRYLLIILAIFGTAITVIPSLTPIVVRADTQITPVNPGSLTSNGCSDNTTNCNVESSIISGLFAKVFTVATLLAAIIASIFIVFNGIRYANSAGDVEKAKTARANIVSILVGIVIIVGAYTIIHFAQITGSIINKL